MRTGFGKALLPVLALFATACAGNVADSMSQQEATAGSVVGYLPREALPDSLALLPPPPAADSAMFAADEQAFRSTRSLKNTPRWALAVQDAALEFPEAVNAFTCAIGVPIDDAHTPHLYTLMRRSFMDRTATSRAKTHYQRRRPFVEFNQESCYPQDDARLRTDGSYPSGHSTLGWTWALVLSELAPERSTEILKRGYAFGESRVVCGAHWQSDVAAGRVIAAAIVAQLHNQPAFSTDMQAARREIATARSRELKATLDCAAEAAALAVPLPGP